MGKNDLELLEIYMVSYQKSLIEKVIDAREDEEKAHFFFVYLLFMFFHCPL